MNQMASPTVVVYVTLASAPEMSALSTYVALRPSCQMTRSSTPLSSVAVAVTVTSSRVVIVAFGPGSHVTVTLGGAGASSATVTRQEVMAPSVATTTSYVPGSSNWPCAVGFPVRCV